MNLAGAKVLISAIVINFAIALGMAQSATKDDQNGSDLELVISDVLRKAPTDRSAADLDASAEAAYILYGLKRDDPESFRHLQATLRELWVAPILHREEAERLEVVAIEFDIATDDELGSISSSHRGDNSFFAFAYCSRLIRTGRVKEAQRTLALVPPNTTFSLREMKGLRALDASVQRQGSSSGRATAQSILKLYQIVPTIDFPFTAGLFHDAILSFDHQTVSEGPQKVAIDHILEAIQSMMSQKELILPATVAVAHLEDIKDEVSILRPVSDTNKTEYETRISAAEKEADTVRGEYSHWMELVESKGLTDEIAGAILNKGQVFAVEGK